MTRFLLRRLLEGILVLVGITVVIFVLMRLAPGDPARLMLPDTAPEVAVRAMRQDLGLDKPIYTQLGRFLIRAATGHFGNSFYYRQPVAKVLMEAVPATMTLAVISMALTILIAVPLGVLAATRRHTLWEPVSLFLGVAGQAMPIFWLGLLLVLLFSVRLHWLPSGGGGTWRHLVMPVITLAGSSAPMVVRLTRSQMLEELGQDYVRTARAKGLTDRAVNYRHAWRNTLIPLVTVVGLQIGTLIGGTVVAETVFNYPGVGLMVYTAIGTRDYPLLQYAVLFISAIFVVINIVVDALYTWIDPRINFQ